MNRFVVGAFVASGMLLAGGGAALAAAGDGDRSARCEERLAKIAEQRGVSVEQLRADVEARLLARIAAAEKAGRISSERAAKLRERVGDANLCGARKPVPARFAAHGMVWAAATFLGLDRAELRAQLPGNSLAGLAEKQGKSAASLKAAMAAPAKARLAKAVRSDLRFRSTDGKGLRTWSRSVHDIRESRSWTRWKDHPTPRCDSAKFRNGR
jgi:hypothetical protein